MGRTRRSVLSTAAGATTVSLAAGCLSEAEFDDADGGYAAFFTLADWATIVGGDVLTFETPVEAGEQGHGWSPSSDLITDIGTSRIFVYLDSPDFPWAQDAAAILERDYDDVIVVDGLEGVHRLEWDHEAGTDGHDTDGDDGHDDHDDDHNTDDHDAHGDDDRGTDGDDNHDDHDHGRFDPHVWLDPVRATTIVESIASGIVDAVPEREQTVVDNAAAYVEKLDELDGRFQDLVVDGRPVGVIASHDSFRYLQNRYGFDLHTPTGVSPDHSPSPSDITETIEFIDVHGIETILYDYFESDRLARTIVEHSSATAVEAVTPAAGTTASWNERGWGYIEQLRNVTIPAFEEALVARD